MRLLECSHEADVAAAVRQRAWRAEDQELRQHVETCAVCAEVAAVCEALAIDDEALGGALVPAGLPSAGQVWLRAGLRTRAEGMRSASRLLLWVHGTAGAAVAGLAAGMAWRWWPAMTSFWKRLEGSIPETQSALPLVVAVGACLALASVAVYLVVRGDQRL